jgi:hypothetical protein
MTHLTKHSAGECRQESKGPSDVEPLSTLESVFSYFSVPCNLRAALEDVVHDEQIQMAIAEGSYLHPLGFTKIPIYSRNGVRARLHVWREAVRPELPHSHRWDLKSKVLAGQVCNEIWAPTRTGEQWFSYRHHSRDASERSRTEPMRPVRLSRILSACHTGGDQYTMAAGAIHRFISISEIAATVAVTGPVSVRHSHFFSQEREARCSLHLPSLSVSQLVAEIETVLRIMTDTSQQEVNSNGDSQRLQALVCESMRLSARTSFVA